jgi:hypothetical protein
VIFFDQPLIVTGEPGLLPSNRWAALADVIVTVAEGRSASGLGTDLFRRYPGLTFVLVVDGDRDLTIRSRDGGELILRADGPISIRSPWLRDLVILLYTERVRRVGLVAQ